MIDLNILKIAGAFVAGIAGIIGILGQTRTQDNKLTRSGKWLFGMAIVGVVLALGTQIWEWRKSIESDRAAREQNRVLLETLETVSTIRVEDYGMTASVSNSWGTIVSLDEVHYSLTSV